MTAPQSILDYYAQPSPLTSAGRYAFLFAELPSDVKALVHIIQGLAIYDVVASTFYGCSIGETRADEIHLRSMEQMLEHLLALDNRPLAVARPPDKRLACRCHNFTRFLVAMLRAKGFPARSRCGFGTYFNAGYFEDHWVCEYWHATEARWVLVDLQFDEVWREKLKIEHDVLDVPRDRFLVASDAWTQCRKGKADPSKFGINFADLRGLWFIAGNLVRDVAALNKMEMLPWDVWGTMPAPHEPLNEEQLTFFDTMAALTHNPDVSFAELRMRYDADDRLYVPATVFNAMLNRQESLVNTDH